MRISEIFGWRRVNKKPSCQEKPVQSFWQGYEADKIVKSFRKAYAGKYSMQEWITLLEKTLFTLSPYYDRVNEIVHQQEEPLQILMLSGREMRTYHAFLACITKRDIWAALHEMQDFIIDYGKYRKKLLSELETFLIFEGIQRIVELMRMEERNKVT